MAPQSHINHTPPSDDDAPTPVPAGDHARAMADDVDALLDEIDEVLESNAETFVRSFVQKGGQ